MKIKCKIDCQVVDCKECAELREEFAKFDSEMRNGITEIKDDKEELFDILQTLVHVKESLPLLLNLCKTYLYDLGVTIPEEEGKNENKV